MSNEEQMPELTEEEQRQLARMEKAGYAIACGLREGTTNVARVVLRMKQKKGEETRIIMDIPFMGQEPGAAFAQRIMDSMRIAALSVRAHSQRDVIIDDGSAQKVVTAVTTAVRDAVMSAPLGPDGKRALRFNEDGSLAGVASAEDIKEAIEKGEEKSDGGIILPGA